MKKLIAPSLSFAFPLLALAHEGHSQMAEGSIFHHTSDLQALVLAGGVVVAAVVIWRGRR
jgi:hypothetical protein